VNSARGHIAVPTGVDENLQMSRSQAEVRDEVLGQIDAIAGALEAEVDAAEAAGRLPASTLEILRSARLFWLKTPTELGGFEAEPALQVEAIERLAIAHPAAAWCMFIQADVAGLITTHLDDDALAIYLDGGEVPATAGGGGLRPGVLEAVDGGYRLTGRFRYGSGITGAKWVLLGGLLTDAEGGVSVRQCVMRKDDLELLDNWNVLGMRGTGSMDFNANGAFVPANFTWPVEAPPLRGGRQYRTGLGGYIGYTIPAVTAGIARRALNAVIRDSATTLRGYSSAKPLADSAAFHSFIGQADLRLKAAIAMMIANGEALMRSVDAQGRPTDAQEAEVRAAAAMATRLTLDVVHELARYSGGSSLKTGATVERAVRDITMASSHLVVTDSAIEQHGRFMLGLPADPMG
jgi:indole-3-acetate monooxygenase